MNEACIRIRNSIIALERELNNYDLYSGKRRLKLFKLLGQLSSALEIAEELDETVPQ
jgi:hypothetical protein